MNANAQKNNNTTTAATAQTQNTQGNNMNSNTNTQVQAQANTTPAAKRHYKKSVVEMYTEAVDKVIDSKKNSSTSKLKWESVQWIKCKNT